MAIKGVNKLRLQAALTLLICLLCFGRLPAVYAQAPAQSASTTQSDDPIQRIRDEGLNRSRVMEIAWSITDLIGPRLTGSPGMKRAREWASARLTEWGLHDVHFESWGPFGRGWSVKRFSAELVAPQVFQVMALPKAWSPSTNGVVTGNVVYLDADDVASLERYRGKLKGAIVLFTAPRDLKPHFEPLATRRDEKELLALANRAEPELEQAFLEATRRRQAQQQPSPEFAARIRVARAQQFYPKKIQFLIDEGAAAAVEVSRAGDGGTILTEQAIVPVPLDSKDDALARRHQSNLWDKKPPANLPQITVAAEHYNRMVRMLQRGEELRMTLDLAVEFHDKDLMGYNTIAEIPGTDLKDEVVMLGAHFDSWHTGTGATDNAAGCAVMMEAVRVLKALDLKPRRTIRLALWEGEEQGLLGSTAYVKEHSGFLGDGTYSSLSESSLLQAEARRRGEQLNLTKRPAYEKISAYYNLDNGAGRIRGIGTNGNEELRPIFRRWLMPFGDLGASTVSAAGSGGTDHVSFYQIGIPAFQFIQDWLEYFTRTHHSNMDVFDRLQEEDLKQSAVIVAAFVYNTAMLEERLPRRPLK